mmetsp:Transcript_16537/g.57943  ORF Transcript_16537/g.57943 Transcript_16537/m.57943 type:complete len:96 (-) Transcript_16537:231-518(-)
MVLSEAEKALKAKAEREAMARKKLEKDRILKDQAADRDYFTARNTSAPQSAPPTAPKVLLRLRYDVDGKKGRKPVELEGVVDVAHPRLREGGAEG